MYSYSASSPVDDMQLHVLWLGDGIPPHMLHLVHTLAASSSPLVSSVSLKQPLHATATLDSSSGCYHTSAGALHDATQGLALVNASDMAPAQKQQLSAFMACTYSAVKCGNAGDQGRKLANTATCWMFYDAADGDKTASSAAESFAASFDSTCLQNIDLVVPVSRSESSSEALANEILGLGTARNTALEDSHSGAADHDAFAHAQALLRMHLLRASAIDAPSMCDPLIFERGCLTACCELPFATCKCHLANARCNIGIANPDLGSVQRNNQYSVRCRSAQAMQLLQQYYTSVRTAHKQVSSSAVTTNTLCTLIRLSMAAARLQLHSSVTVRDAMLALRMVEETFLASDPELAVMVLGKENMKQAPCPDQDSSTDFDAYLTMLVEQFSPATVEE